LKAIVLSDSVAVMRLDEAVPEDRPIRKIAAVLDLSWVHCELASYYPNRRGDARAAMIG